ncbi:INPP phosphatase, partial [Syrrhaptes paradoxus]|nr:INPP phosphatase [Syrrhaptes paradoxus]
MAGLLQAVVGAAEKAAQIARLCRGAEPLFQLLVAEKTGTERNRRFLQDFKTLADVLIQEVIKHDLGKEFPELQGHIHGEESNEFRNTQGDTVTVRVCATPEDTAALLLAVLDECEAAELLAAAAHRDVALGDAEVAGVVLSMPPQDLAIWIDPIDSTNEYIRGREDVAPVDGIAPGGLCSALVLVGAYDRHTGCPVLGVVNEPFFRRDPLTGRWQGRYHWGVAYGDTRLSSLSPPPLLHPVPRVVLSRAEGAAVRGALGPLCGDRLRFAAGAGYKMLCVILGRADAYVLSEGSTFAWDACAPHAILRALGGGVVALAGALRAWRDGDTRPPPELVYNRPVEGAVGAERWANQGGLVAYVHPQHLEAVLATL